MPGSWINLIWAYYYLLNPDFAIESAMRFLNAIQISVSGYYVNKE